MKWYVWFQFSVVLYNIGMQIIGRKNMDGHGDGLSCFGPGGHKWLYKSWWGEAFVTLHIFQVITQAVMVEQIFYTIPHKLHVFDHDKKELELSKELMHDQKQNDEDSTMKGEM
jgi:hypothetical protein